VAIQHFSKFCIAVNRRDIVYGSGSDSPTELPKPRLRHKIASMPRFRKLLILKLRLKFKPSSSDFVFDREKHRRLIHAPDIGECFSISGSTISADNRSHFYQLQTVCLINIRGTSQGVASAAQEARRKGNNICFYLNTFSLL
jgi:hypothetical protein